MNKAVFFTLAFFSIALQHSIAQVNIDSIATYYASPEGRLTYIQNTAKLNALDSTLQKKDFVALYYGTPFQPHFDIDLIDSIENKIKEYNLLQEFMLAYELCDSLLLLNPVSITAYFEKSFSCYALKRSAEEAINNQKYRIFAKCVLRSGNGSTAAPFKVVSYNDAIEVVKYLQVKYKQLILIDDTTIVAELTKKYQGETNLYFQLVAPLHE